MPQPQTRRLLPAVLVAVALFASACGSSDAAQVASLEDPGTVAPVAAGDLEATDDTGTTTTAADLDPEEAMLAFTQCMRDEGVEMSDPEVDANGNLRLARPEGVDEGNRDEVRAARGACAGFLEGVRQEFDNVDRTELQDTLLAYAQCMRDNGYEEMGDPDLSSFGPGARAPGEGGGPFGDIDREDPDFIAADEVCRAEFGEFGPGRGPGGAPGGGGG